MTNIHFPVDGQGTQALQKQNKTNKSTFHVDTVAPESDDQHKSDQEQPGSRQAKQEQTESSSIATTQTQQTTESREEVSRSVDRRQKDRRHDNIPVLLNTRSEHDRRKTAGQRKEDAKQPNHTFGIDTKA